jgi:hypothetical protein
MVPGQQRLRVFSGTMYTQQAERALKQGILCITVHRTTNMAQIHEVPIPRGLIIGFGWDVPGSTTKDLMAAWDAEDGNELAMLELSKLP